MGWKKNRCLKSARTGHLTSEDGVMPRCGWERDVSSSWFKFFDFGVTLSLLTSCKFSYFFVCFVLIFYFKYVLVCFHSAFVHCYQNAFVLHVFGKCAWVLISSSECSYFPKQMITTPPTSLYFPSHNSVCVSCATHWSLPSVIKLL